MRRVREPHRLPAPCREAPSAQRCSPHETVELTTEGTRGVLGLVSSPLAEAHALPLGERAARDALSVVVSSYEFHGGFRLKTLSA